MKRTVLLLFLWPLCFFGAEPNTVVATINTGVTPDGIAITPDSRFAYVANNNNYSIDNSDTVSVLDLANNTLETTISDASFNQPYTVTINAAGTIAYVTNSFGTTVTRIDIETNTVLGTIDGFNGPSGMVITPDGVHAYVNNYGSGTTSGTGMTVSRVDLESNTIVGSPIMVDMAPSALAITPDGAFVYVACYVEGTTGDGTVRVIDTTTNLVVGPAITGFSGPFAITITPDGDYAYVTNFGSNNFTPIGTTASVIDLNSNTVVDTVDLAIQPAGIAITPDGALAYVSNYNTLYANSYDLVAGVGTVNIIDTETNELLTPTIVVGQSPGAIAISPNGAFAYVSNYSSNAVSVIALQTFQIVAQGKKIKNVFLTQKELVNKLTWTVSGMLLPVSYSIYRDAGLTDLAGTVMATDPFVFLDHDRTSGVTYTYYIIGTSEVGTTSVPVEVIVTD